MFLMSSSRRLFQVRFDLLGQAGLRHFGYRSPNLMLVWYSKPPCEYSDCTERQPVTETYQCSECSTY